MFCQDFIKPSMIHESLLIGYLWNNPKLYKKYKDYDFTNFNVVSNTGTFTIEMWYFYFSLGMMMSNSGIQNFNDTSTYAFISSQPDVGDESFAKRYKKYGGFKTVYTVMEECKQDSNEQYHLSEIQKYELLRYYELNGLINADLEIIKKGKKVKNKDMLCKMTLDQVKSYFQFFIKKGGMTVGSSNMIITNFSDDIDETIDNCNEGSSMGIELFNSPRLNDIIKGWQMGNFIFLCLASGVGKSTFTNAKFDLGIYHSNEKCTRFVNEENKKRTQSVLISTVSSTITNDPITRDRLSEGHFTKEEWDKINKAKEWIKSRPPEQIKFAEIQKFYLDDFLETVELHKSLGYNYALLDTLKPDSTKQSDMARWEKFSGHAQSIFDCIKPTVNNVGCLCTLQLLLGAQHKFLDLDCIGKSKEIVETADIILMGRMLFEDEYEKLQVYDYVKGDFGFTKEEVYLDLNCEYMILFIPKNRNGSKSQQVVYKVDYDVNRWEEIGYCSLKKNAR